ncbi:hypothetical protein DFH08DRAFT_825894 [Mycena albidolilacea]|uniref:Ribonuclease H1 N-terminal domain-containing protein n=1 Tax=Mycena albidolilacea TaxID=1033008 RepID=A0AAD6Z192_9AGAR|nr:hypothetical protein DFH08DRAFT_825894 [Mycena albidolilacea]
MQPPTAPATALSARAELMVVLATVDELVVRTLRIQCTALDLQTRLPRILGRLAEEEAADNCWVRAVAKSPVQVAALNAGVPDGSRHCWVVFVGREPGIYYTIEEADHQIKGCPGQEYRSKKSKSEALASYTHWFQEGKVEKWVELTDDALPRSSIT